jgi:hypothetical protein
MTLILARPAALCCDRCARPDADTAPLAIVGHRLLCGDCARYERLSACRLHIATCTKAPECSAIRFQLYVAGLSHGLAVLEGHTDATWWRKHASAGTHWLLTYGAAEIVEMQDEYDAATFAEDVA